MATNRSGSWLSWQRIAAALAGQCAVTSTQWVGVKPVPPIVSIWRYGTAKPQAWLAAIASARWSAW
jgi:hypothetical protein